MTKFLKNVDVTGYVSQTSVTSSLVKTDANGKLVAAVAGTDYNAPGVTASAGTLVREIRNTTGATLTKGTIVYISGATGNKPTVSKALATGDSTSAQTFGMCQTDIPNNSNGNVVCFGDLSGLNTSAFTEGAQLYLSSTTAGEYTTTKQLAPAHLVYIGVVTRAHPTLGQIEVRIQNGYELDEIHDVAISSLANNQGLFYESATDLWKNKTIATVLGYTPQPQLSGTGFVKIDGTTISYDNSTYLTTANAASTYLPLIGGTLSGFTRLTVDNSYFALNRSATNKFLGLLYETNDANQWFVGLRETGTNNYIIYNEVTAEDALTIDRATNNVTILRNISAANLSGTNTGDQTNIPGASTRLSSRDNRTISPSEDSASELRFGFTSWANNDSAPYADYLHMRSYSDNSGGSDNLVMFLKSGIGMRIWQQTYGSGTAYSSYVDVLHSSNYSSYALPLSGGTMSGQILAPSTGADVYGGAIHIRERGYVLAAQSAWSFSPAITFHWGDRAASRFGLRADGLMAVDDAPIALRSWVTAQAYITGYTETDTLASVTGRGASTSTALSINNNVTITSGRLVLQSGGVNTYGVISGYANNNHFITMRGAVTGTAASPTITGADQTTFVEYADANDTTGWFFKSSSTGTYQEIARITRSTFNYGGNTVIHSGNIGSQSVNYSNYSNYLSNNYNGGVSSNPQTYFGQGVGVKVAMTGQWGVWSDTLWINGYAGGDVLQMCALHTQRNGTPRMGISVQASNSTSYGTIYEVITSYNIASQSVSSATTATNVGWSGVTSKPAAWLNTTNLIDSNPPDTIVPSGFWQDIGGAGNPVGTWFNYINVRHSNPGNAHGYQLGMSYYDNNLWFRSYQGSGTYQAWSRALATNTDPIPSNMNQYVRTTDNVAFNALSLPTGGRVIINGETDTWGVRFRTDAATTNLGSSLKNILFCGGGSNEGFAVTGVGTGTTAFEVRNNGVVFVKDSLYNINLNGTIQSGSTSLGGMLFDSGRPALVARGSYPHVEIWADIANSNHGGTLRFGGYDNGSSGAYKSWHIGTAAADLYFLDIGYGGTSNSNPHAGIAGLGAAYGYPGAFTSMRFHNNGNVGIGNFGTYGSGDNTPGFKLDVRGTGRFTGVLSVNNNILVTPQSSSWAEGVAFSMPTTSSWGGLRWRRERSNNDGNWGLGFTALDSTDDLVFSSNNGGTQIDNILRLRKDGSIFSVSPVGTDSHGRSYTFRCTQSAAGNHTPILFQSDFGNHSWGIVARFYINQVGADRPSIQFANAGTDNRWAVGYCYPDDNFRITQNHGFRNDGSTSDGWGSERLRINTDGTAQFFSTLTATAFFESSDSRLKTLVADNIQVNGIENLTAKLYIKDGREEYGYYAQEAQKYMPSAVVANDKGYLNLSYREVHTAKIARLEKEVEELKSQLARL
jgi:hypothetical protein